jgi:predicted component of type VI protein secretion system
VPGPLGGRGRPHRQGRDRRRGLRIGRDQQQPMGDASALGSSMDLQSLNSTEPRSHHSDRPGMVQPERLMNEW